MEPAARTCPRCGSAATGNFCSNCGATLGAPTCVSCGTPLGATANFCHKCGTPVGGAAAHAAPVTAAAPRAATRPDRTPWIIAALAVVAIIVVVAWSATRRSAAPPPNMANAGNATGLAGDPGTIPAPNIDSLSPKERFLRLQMRIDQQLERKDTTRLSFFMDMALAAYNMLSPADRDVDVRFHAAILEAEAGLFPNARAQADTILAQAPDNLLAYYVRATVAESAGDSAQAKSARAAFREHYATEIKKPRPEYVEHKGLLDDYFKGAGAK